VCVLDSFQFGGPTNVPASVSFKVRWEATGRPERRGRGGEVPPTDPAAFLGRFAAARSTGSFSGFEVGFSFKGRGHRPRLRPAGSRTQRHLPLLGRPVGGTSMPPTHPGRRSEQLPGALDALQRPVPRSSMTMSEPTTRSRTVLEARTSPGPAAAITRAATWTAMPATSPSRSSTSPVCSPARTCRPMPPSSSPRAAAQRTARPGPSKVARMPSPVVLTS
jgi:hypothetical protein